MGATVSTRKLAAAFQATSGQQFYLMFEETFEMNCYPRTPRWSCYAIGNLEHVIARIFLAGSACEGGMLKGAGCREITPERYVGGWMKELENPVEFADRTITLEVGNDFSASIPKGQFQKVKEKLIGLGRQDLASILEQGQSVALSLYADAELICALYEGNTLAPWRIINSHETPVYGLQIRNPDLGYKPQKAKAYQLTLPRFYRIKENNSNLLIQGEDGHWRCEGWDFSCVASYVANLWATELREPGSYRCRIKAYRDATTAAPCLPSQGVKIIIDTTVALDEYEQRCIEQVAQELPHTRASGLIHLNAPTEDTMLHRVTQLPVSCTKWSITKHVAFEQLDLLAG